MRRTAAGLLCAAVVAVSAPAAHEVIQADQRLAQARDAIGGPALRDVKTLLVRYNSRELLGTLPPARNPYAADQPAKPREYAQTTTELKLLLPDSCLLTTEQSAPFPRAAFVVGFAGKRTIGKSVTVRQRCGYLTLALLLDTSGAFPFRVMGMVGDAIHLNDPNGVNVFLDVERPSAQPQRIRYDELFWTPGGELTGDKRPTELELLDYRAVGKLRFPHLIRVMSNGILLAERRIDLIQINSGVAASDFKN